MSDWFGPDQPGEPAGIRPLDLSNQIAVADNSGDSWASGSWWQQLSPGSWRGVPFVLDLAQNKMGRRIALH